VPVVAPQFRAQRRNRVCANRLVYPQFAQGRHRVRRETQRKSDGPMHRRSFEDLNPPASASQGDTRRQTANSSANNDC
jgi:hypothetical protein